MQAGDRLLVRFIGPNGFVHPMHIHGGPFLVVAIDVNPLPEGSDQYLNTVNIGPRPAIQRHLDRPKTGQMAAALPYQPPNDE